MEKVEENIIPLGSKKRIPDDEVIRNFNHLSRHYGFQDDNVKNQCEYLLMLLENRQALAAGDGVNGVFQDILSNYQEWCDYIKKEQALPDDEHGQRKMQKQLLLISLYLLIWGEAANLRFMPECLCYIFHRLAHHALTELPVASNEVISGISKRNSTAFLEKVVKPIYRIVTKEAEIHAEALKSNKTLNHRAVSHATWRNYDDWNEYFWSSSCFDGKWEWSSTIKQFLDPTASTSSTSAEKSEAEPKMKSSASTSSPSTEKPTDKDMKPSRGQGKVMFVEHRTFLHIYHSFHRLWMFNVMMLQGLAILAFEETLGFHTLNKLLSLGPTYVVMRFIQSSIDVLGLWGACKGTEPPFLLRIFMEFIFFGVFSGVLTYIYVKFLQEAAPGISDSYYFKVYISVVGLFAILFVLRMCTSFCSRKFIDYIKEQYYVGRKMREKPCIVLGYLLFWTVLLTAKLTVSFFFQIKPLVQPTKAIVHIKDINYAWHDIVSKNNHNALTVASLWVPVILVYFLDTQIWYTVCSALLGSIIGATDHLGEIRSLQLLHEYFDKLPQKFSAKLIFNPPASRAAAPAADERSRKRSEAAKRFAPYWNRLVENLWEEYYLSKREMELLLMPVLMEDTETIQWPLFLLLNKVQLAKSLATKNENILDEIKSDNYMFLAVKEIYYGVKRCLEKLLEAQFVERQWVSFKDLKQKDFEFKKLPGLVAKVEVLVKKLANVAVAPETSNQLLAAAKDLYGYYFTDFARNQRKIDWNGFKVEAGWLKEGNNQNFVERLKRLLLAEESALDVPRNLEARRRLLFFGNSLLMKMPPAPSVEKMLSFSVLTPHYDEEVLYSLKYLRERNRDGITNLFYLQKVFSDEWKFFLEKHKVQEGHVETYLAEQQKEEKEREERQTEEKEEEREKRGKRDTLLLELRLWASYRGQTLARTVRGIMYYRDALIFQHKLEPIPGDVESGRSSGDAQRLANMKFTYVVSCQTYGEMKRSKDPKAEDIDYLMKKYPGLRIAYIDKQIDNQEEKFYSKLIKYVPSTEVKEVYSIQLPGKFLVGEGKPENQNHAIIFTRGDAIQAIDMNQDNYFEEALKMRNLLEEFEPHKKTKKPTILGVREYIFTGSVSSLAWFMSTQESSFVTLSQRVMARPLKVRMHYGHPDLFDRLFHITRGGISKASKTINLSEDIFAGFNSTLRGGSVTHHEYIQVGKGRDLGLNQISTFEAKVSRGNGEQMLSRDVYRLGRLFDFFRMLSFYYTSVGYYVSTMLTVWALYAFLYGKAYLALSGVEDELLRNADVEHNTALRTALTTQFLFQIGFFNCIPMLMGYILEQGILKAVFNFLTMQLLFSSVFFAFSLGTRSHYFGRTILHGGAKYTQTGRGFVIEHIPFAENYRMYSRSHFVRGLEIVMLLSVYFAYGSERGISFLLMSISNWFLAFSWLYAPFLFNPLGLEWQKTVEDWNNWNKWLTNQGAAAKDDESWSAWWEGQHPIRTYRSMILETLLSLRFFMIQYGVVYHLKGSGGSSSLLVYGISWIFMAGITVWIVFLSLSTKSNNCVRIFHGLTVMLVLALFILGSIFLLRLTLTDVFASVLAILPTGWGLLSIAVACKHYFEKCKLWWMITACAQWFDGMMGYVIFAPIILISWFPFISPLQTRILFNQEFSRGLEISVLLSGNRASDMSIPAT